ncbi:Bud-site selection protein [Saitoella complicata NRRL Y-17804]|uniref:Bud22 domain-containing protein n=1 Tax=Saitoella complicata (strain BCRC 22490 / CBS 7301 / JCM 7358 / NBRC 10748 / NRRL Y-17804) TaxID=698492 RepID=A0A0E9NHJ3_SAICN|nr:Bud-site selection protein [Saitoella complicata NRRL Y-17804]ODQ56012.1 Bud-site selection protein [Saitoella complicata NRRL Y-17804]GAO49357.1 hypothetical protein G7K_3508-t1 [Saitoella complicata NRRL Y-17804]
MAGNNQMETDAHSRKRKRTNLEWELERVKGYLGEDPKLVRVKMALGRERHRHREAPEFSDRQAAVNKAKELQKQLVEQKVFHANKEALKALKKAKTFETQKLVKRLKTAREAEEKDDAQILRLEAEMSALKEIDLPKLANVHISNKLHKRYDLVETGSLPDAVENPYKDSPDSTKNVIARLFNTKVVKEVADTAVESVGRATGVVEKPKAVDEKKEAKKARKKEAKAKARAAKEATARGEEISGSDAEDESEGSDEEEVEDFFDMGDASDEEKVPPVKKSKKRAASADFSDEDSAPPAKKEKKEKKATKEAKLPKKPDSTVFLPSLSAGYFSGGSDSDADREYAEFDKKERKNRMGQRARRALAEKKFGRHAAHVKKEQEERQKEREAFDERKKKREVRDTIKAKELAEKEAKRRELEAKPVHPSWAAKQALKEKEKTIVPFQGKKITFD